MSRLGPRQHDWLDHEDPQNVVSMPKVRGRHKAPQRSTKVDGTLVQIKAKAWGTVQVSQTLMCKIAMVDAPYF